MSAQIIEPASITLDIAGTSLDAEEIVANSTLSAQLIPFTKNSWMDT